MLLHTVSTGGNRCFTASSEATDVHCLLGGNRSPALCLRQEATDVQCLAGGNRSPALCLFMEATDVQCLY